MNVYYRSKDKKLQCINASTDDHKEAIECVMEHLHQTREVFLKPILAVVLGGKKT